MADSATTVQCARCGRPEAPALPRPQGVHPDVGTVAQETLTKHMKEFLFPAEAKPGEGSPLMPLK